MANVRLILFQIRPPYLAGAFIGLAFLSAALILGASAPQNAEDQFLSEVHGTMATMHAGMTVPSTGDVDTDFVAMMIPHHQGAIDMARAELRYGHNERLKRIAQEIIVTQQEEIAVMRLTVGQPPLPSSGSIRPNQEP